MKRLHLQCGTHGKGEWLLTIVCKDWGRVYQAVKEGDDFEPICEGAVRSPEVCACGSRLPPPDGSARAICTRCFMDRVAAGSGPVS